jgi:malate dehydrogenase (oxaloacetate-decarboxylating)
MAVHTPRVSVTHDRDLLRDPRLNRGTAFTPGERTALRLEGLLPADVIKWTDGRGLVGTGTPWAPVHYEGTDYAIGQANNALIYPGIGLGMIVSRASQVTDGMLLAASQAIAGLMDIGQPGAGLLPDVENLRAVSATVAVAVARQATDDGVADPNLADPVQAVQDAMWQAEYESLDVT